jgi:hypothetical protein
LQIKSSLKAWQVCLILLQNRENFAHSIRSGFLSSLGSLLFCGAR